MDFAGRVTTWPTSRSQPRSSSSTRPRSISAGSRAIRTQAWDKVALIQHTIRWPTWPGEDWIRGFLAGIFDAEGGCCEGVFRISNTDPEIIDWTTRGLARFGFRFAIEDRRSSNGLKVIRLLGGLPEQTPLLSPHRSRDPAEAVD